MLYYGYFRSIDTSIDPLGQKFKVEIFTGGERVYPFREVDGMPLEGTEITLTDSPFVVNYVGEDNNIFKGYKCSTATLSFIMNTFNPDFFSSKPSDILVVLLKERHDWRVEGNTLTNDDGKRATIHTIETETSSIRLFYPQEEDVIKYDVEWVGFATPNSYNQNYTLFNQAFELECQDALSTLQYKKKDIKCGKIGDNIKDFHTVIQRMIAELGVYRHIYFSQTIRVPDTENVSSLKRILINLKNYYNEDDKEYDSWLSILGEMMQFLNLTMIPYGGSIYILNYDGIVNEEQYYYHYEIDANYNTFFYDTPYVVQYATGDAGQVINPFINRGEKLVYHNIDLQYKFAGSDTNISISTCYTKIKVSNNENMVNNMLCDISDSKNLDYTETFANAEIESSVDVPYGNWSTGSDLYRYFSKLNDGGYISFSKNKTIKNYIYGRDTVEIIAGSNSYTRTTWQNDSNIRIPNNVFHDSFYDDYVGSCIINNIQASGRIIDIASSSSASLQTDNSSRTSGILLFHKTLRYSVPGCVINYTNQKPIIVEFNTGDFIRNYKDSLVIKGNCTFYQYLLPLYSETYHQSYKVDRNRLCLEAEISMTNSSGQTLYFNPTGLSSAKWSKEDWSYTRCFCKLPLFNYDDYDVEKPFGQQFHFQNTNSALDCGLIIPLTTRADFMDGSDDLCSIKIKIVRPTGCAYRTDDNNTTEDYYANSTLLSNIEIKTVQRDLLSSWEYTFDSSTTSTINDGDVVEELELDNTLSSVYISNSKSYSDYSYFDNNYKYFSLKSTNNTATGCVNRPEILRLADYYNQYSNPKLTINSTMHYSDNYKPYTKATWDSQFEGINFIVDSMSIDYEMNRNTVSFVEKVLSSYIPETKIDVMAKQDTFNSDSVLNPYFGEENSIDRRGYSYGYNSEGEITSMYGSDMAVVDLNEYRDIKSEANIKFTPYVNVEFDGLDFLVIIPDDVDNVNVYIDEDNNLIIDNNYGGL